MTNLIELGAAAGATAVAVVLGVAFWPHMENSAAAGKSSVLQPVYVAAAAPPALRGGAAPIEATAPAAPPPAAGAPAADSSAIAKLAMALQTGPANSSAKPATRSIALASPVGAAHASEAARRFCAQGLVALAAGDIAGARLYLERAVEGGDARAFMVLGETYDPAALARLGALGVKGEAVRARDYYAKALAAGMGAARERIAALEAQ